MPSGIPLAAGDPPRGLQRLGIGLVAVCDEINSISKRCVVQRESGSANCNKSAFTRSRGACFVIEGLDTCRHLRPH